MGIEKMLDKTFKSEIRTRQPIPSRRPGELHCPYEVARVKSGRQSAAMMRLPTVGLTQSAHKIIGTLTRDPPLEVRLQLHHLALGMPRDLKGKGAPPVRAGH